MSKYLCKSFINSSIKQYGVRMTRCKNSKEFCFIDLATNKVVKTITLDHQNSLTIGGWKDAAAAASGTVTEGYAQAKATYEIAEMMRRDALKVRELLESLNS